MRHIPEMIAYAHKDVLVAPETISDEDLGQPIGRSPSTDDLNLLEFNSRTPQQNSRIQNASASTSTSKFFSANDVPSDPGPSKPKPRPSTSEEPIVIEDDDEIQDFTDDEHAKKRSGSRPPKGTVSKQRALYERSQAPKLNLQAIHNEGQTLQSQKVSLFGYLHLMEAHPGSRKVLLRKIG